MSSLRHMIHAAAPCPIDTKHAMIDWWGPVIDEYYAASEGGGTLVSTEEWLKKPGTVGKAMADLRDRDLRRRGQASFPANEIGTVYMAMSAGGFEYHKDKQKTEKNRIGRFFTVGDVGYLDDDGYLFLCDRKTDMIISGGANIYPAEIENVLLGSPFGGGRRRLRDPARGLGRRGEGRRRAGRRRRAVARARGRHPRVLRGPPCEVQDAEEDRLHRGDAPRPERQALQAQAARPLLGGSRAGDLTALTEAAFRGVSRPALRERRVHGAEQIAHVERLDQVVDRSELAHHALLIRGAVGAHDHDGDPGRHRVGLKAPQHFGPGLVRQVKVQQDEVGLVLASQVKSERAMHRSEQSHVATASEHVLDERQVGEVVLDQKDARGSARAPDPLPRLPADCPDPRGAGASFRTHLERGPFAHPGEHVEHPAHPLDEVLGDAEPDAGSLDPDLLSSQSFERLEEPRHVLFTDADPGVAHRDPDEPCAKRLAGDPHLPTGRVVLAGVREQVQQAPAATAAGRRGRTPSGRATPPPTRSPPRDRQEVSEPDRVVHESKQVDRLHREVQVAHLDPRDVEHLVDQPEQMSSRPQDVRDGFFLRG